MISLIAWHKEEEKMYRVEQINFKKGMPVKILLVDDWSCKERIAKWVDPYDVKVLEWTGYVGHNQPVYEGEVVDYMGEKYVVEKRWVLRSKDSNKTLVLPFDVDTNKIIDSE